jgi:uncharacterized protein
MGKESPDLLIEDQILQVMVDRLIAAFRPDRIYLFGSKARDDENADSDYDLMVVVADDAPSEKLRSRLAYQVLRGTRAAADVLVWTKTAFDKRLHIPSSLPSVIEREGKLLYAV